MPEHQPPVTVHVHRPSPSLTVLRVDGEIDMLTAPSLAEHLTQALSNSRSVVVDLERVSFFGALGLRCLLAGQGLASRRGAALYVTGAGHRSVTRVLEIDGVRQLLSINDEAVDALAARLLPDLSSPREGIRAARPTGT